MGKNSAPSAPDPYKTAQAQSTANKEAIQESAKVNAVDQYGPSGSTTYTRDKNGIPTAQTVKLGNSEQQFYDTSGRIRNDLGSLAEKFSSYLPTTPYTMPDSMTGDNVSSALYQRKLGMVQPQLDDADKQSAQLLSDRGIPIGSEIWNTEMNRLSKAKGDTLASLSNDAVLAGGQEQNRQLQNALTLRALPFNELSAFLQGSPSMQTPNFQSTPAYNVQAPDISGLINNNYSNQLSQYNNQQSSLANGLFGLGAAGLSLLSDVRAKKDIQKIGKLDNGLNIYRYRYKGEDGDAPKHVGLMAQEVETIAPWAVAEGNDGFKRVNYDAAVETA